MNLTRATYRPVPRIFFYESQLAEFQRRNRHGKMSKPEQAKDK